MFCNSYRNPQLLANVHTTIDQLANGRVIFGIGAGWFERDYDEYGYDFGTAPERLRALARDLPLIKQRLAKLNPAAVGPMPILIGGAGEKVTLRLVAEHADMWHAFGGTETYLAKSAILAEHCAKIGRDPNTIERVWGAFDGIEQYADDLAAAGVSEIEIGVGGSPSGYDLGPLRELVQWRDRYNAGA